MSDRTRLKTHSRLVSLFKSHHTIKTSKGKILFRIDSPGSVPQDPESNRSEPETFEWIDTHLKPNQVLWDIGANIGVFSLFAALEGNNQVISLEPSAESFATLNANIRLNKLDKQISAFCFAGASSTQMMKLFMKDASSGASHNSIKNAENQFGDFDVNGEQAIIAISLDDLTKLFKLPMPNHIKLDVDGKEPEILEGATETLKGIDTIHIEVEGKNLTDNISIIESCLSEAGLIEDKAWRNKGSGRNRLFKRAL